MNGLLNPDDYEKGLGLSCEGKDKQLQLLLVDCNYISHFKRKPEILRSSLFNSIVKHLRIALGWDTQILPLDHLTTAFCCGVSEAWRRHGSEPSLPAVWLLSEDSWTQLDRAGPRAGLMELPRHCDREGQVGQALQAERPTLGAVAHDYTMGRVLMVLTKQQSEQQSEPQWVCRKGFHP